MKSPLLAIQKAVVAHIQAQNIEVFDTLPDENTPYPFVVIDNDVLSDISTKTTPITNILYPMYVWSKSSQEAKELIDVLVQNFIGCEDDLEMDGFTIENIQIDSIRTNKVLDGTKYLVQTILTLRFTISEV